jgi:RNA polymerase sigma-70 factor (ECF subfamily)
VSNDLALEQRPREYWVEPIPDAAALPAADISDPEELAILRESIRLAFVAALQYLPPRQRAVLLLTQALSWSAAESAESLGITVSAEQTKLAARYVDAFERYDVAALTSLLHEEATLSMPPYDLWLQGHESISKWLLGFGIGCKGSRLVPVEACGGTPAFAQYRDGGETPWALLMLELTADRIMSMTSYLDVETLFPRFGLPMHQDR